MWAARSCPHGWYPLGPPGASCGKTTAGAHGPRMDTILDARPKWSPGCTDHSRLVQPGNKIGYLSCLYIYLHLSVCVCVSACSCVYLYGSVCVYVHLLVSASICLHLCVSLCLCLHLLVSRCMCLHLCLSLCLACTCL